MFKICRTIQFIPRVRDCSEKPTDKCSEAELDEDLQRNARPSLEQML